MPRSIAARVIGSTRTSGGKVGRFTGVGAGAGYVCADAAATPKERASVKTATKRVNIVEKRSLRSTGSPSRGDGHARAPARRRRLARLPDPAQFAQPLDARRVRLRRRAARRVRYGERSPE